MGEGGGEAAVGWEGVPGAQPDTTFSPTVHLQTRAQPVDLSFLIWTTGRGRSHPASPATARAPNATWGALSPGKKGQVQKPNGATAPRWPQVPCSPAHRATPAHQPLRQKSPELRLFIRGLSRTPQAPLLLQGWSATALHPTSRPSTSSCFPLVTLQGPQDTVSTRAPGVPILELLMLHPWRPSPHLWANSSPEQIPPPPGGPPGCPFPELSLPGHFG